MKILPLGLFIALSITPVIAWSDDCNDLLQQTDDILSTLPGLDEETIIDEDNVKTIKQLREQGEELQKSGNNEECTEVMNRALELLKNET